VKFLDVTHITLRVVGDLRAAEAFYCELFGLVVAWREPVPENAPFDLTWDELDAAGVSPEIVMLHEGRFRLAVTLGEASAGRGVIDHVGLQVTPEHFRAVRERARRGGFAVVFERQDELFDFVDPFGVEWELDTRSFENPLAIVEAKRIRELGGG